MEGQPFYITNPSYWRNSVSLFASQHCCLDSMAEAGRGWVIVFLFQHICLCYVVQWIHCCINLEDANTHL